MTIDPLNAHSFELDPTPVVNAQIVRSGRRMTMAGIGKEGPELISGPVLDAAAATSTSPGHVTIYDVKNQQVVINSPAPHNLASA